MTWEELNLAGPTTNKGLGDGFRCYMNRPCARVHVYTWQLFNRIFPEVRGHMVEIRSRPHFRTDAIRESRVMLANAIRTYRNNGNQIILPIFCEHSGEYIWQQKRKAVAKCEEDKKSKPQLRQAYQPKTGQKCGCRRGVMRDNCANCEGTGWVIDFRAIRERSKVI